MNYDQARERQQEDGSGSGIWDWTTKNDDVVRQAPPCSDACRHESQKDAERHFWQYCLDSAEEYETTQMQKPCAVCGKWTTKGLVNRSLHLIGFGDRLCDDHRNKDELAKLHPFPDTPGALAVTHS